MNKRYLIIGALLTLGVTCSAVALAGCEPPEEKVPEITEKVRYSEKTNPYAELLWNEFPDIDDWAAKQTDAPIYYQFEGSYSEAYQGNYNRDYLYMNCYEDGSLHATWGGRNNYYGYWTNVDKRGNQDLVLHVLNYNGSEYNSGIYDLVCDKTNADYYEYSSNIYNTLNGGRTITISGYHYSPIKSLEITTSPENTDYIINDSFTTKGLVVTVNRENGKSIAIDQESFGKSDCRVKFSGFDGKTEGEQEIKVNYIYTDVEATYKVSVLGIKSIAVDAAKGKVNYHVGDEFDKNGLSVVATRTDDKKVNVDSTSRRLKYEGFDAKEATDKQTITVKLDNTYSATFDIKVYAIDKLEIDASQAKKEYFVGDKVSKDNIKVMATFKDGVTDEVAAARFDIEDFDSSRAVESQTVNVAFQGLKKPFTVKIVAPEFKGTGKYGAEKGEVKIKVVTPDECEYTYKGKTITLNYKTMNAAGKTIYNLSLPAGSSVSEDEFNSLHKQYILDKEDFSLTMATVYEIPSDDRRAEQEPMPGIGGNTEQRFIIIDEEAQTATITYKYWYASNTDTFVCKYTIENGVLTFTQLVKIEQIGGGGASFDKLYKTWTLKDNYEALKYTPPEA